jgi:glycosyltransferase involved in cell wall biosynthesis
MRLAYLVSKYPAVSHTFIQREIVGLRARGHEIHTISVRRAETTDVLSDRDRAEAARTTALLPTGLRRLLSAHVAAALAAPRAYVETLRQAVGLGRRRGTSTWMQLMYFGEAMLLADVLRRKGIDHVHVHFANNGSDIALLAASYGRLAGRSPRSWSITVHGPTDFYDVTANGLAAKTRDAAGVICISDFGRSQMMGQTTPELWNKLHVARYGVHVPEISANGHRGSRELTILNVARLAPVKGHAVLLHAFCELLDACPNARVVIVGGGPLRGDLEALAAELGIEDRVDLTGPVSQDSLGEYYRSADVFCLPSFAEGLPIVLMEAMSFGLPVVSTSVMGIPELVRHDREGLLAPPGRADLISECLAAVLLDEGLRGRLGAAARARIEEEYTLDASVRGIEQALERITK